jgi:RNA recognition motif-containing protein
MPSQLPFPPGAMRTRDLQNDMTQVQFAALFAPYGPVLSARIVADRHTGSSKGFGCVQIAPP